MLLFRYVSDCSDDTMSADCTESAGSSEASLFAQRSTFDQSFADRGEELVSVEECNTVN